MHVNKRKMHYNFILLGLVDVHGTPPLRRFLSARDRFERPLFSLAGQKKKVGWPGIGSSG